jgi:hypothetical protein
MIRQWHRRTRVGFHEFDEDRDTSTVGRVEVSSSSDGSSDGSDDSYRPSAEESTPSIELSTPRYATLWNLTVPILHWGRTRSSECPQRQQHPPENDSKVEEDEDTNNALWQDELVYRSKRLPTIKTTILSVIPSGTPETSNDREEEEYPSPIDYRSHNPQSPTDRGLPPASPPFASSPFSTIQPSSPEGPYIVPPYPHVYKEGSLCSPQAPATVPTSPEADCDCSSGEHCNPPYIPPVQPSFYSAKTPRAGLFATPSARQQDAKLITPHALDYRQAPTEPAPPVLWATPPNARGEGMDDVSSLGGDSLGETPSRLLLLHHDMKLQEASDAAHTIPTMETTRQSRRAAAPLAWLVPAWIKRIPPKVRYALCIGTSLWVLAAALVAMTIVLRDQERSSAQVETPVSSEWLEGWTQAPLPEEDLFQDVVDSTPSPSMVSTPLPSRRPSETNRPTGVVVSSARPTAAPSRTLPSSSTTNVPTFFVPPKMGMRQRR